MELQELIDLYVQQEIQKQKEHSRPYKKLNGYVSKANNMAKNMQTAGAYFGGLNNEFAQGLGTKLSNGANVLGDTSSKISDFINTPQNYFKGFANDTLGNGATKIGEYLAGKTGAANTIGNAMTNLGSSLLESGAATTGASAAGAAAGGAASGAASGAAAGGGMGAAFSNPYTAIAAILAMAITGANRKRAKKSGEELMNQTQEIANSANDESQQQLDITQQNAKNQVMQSAQNLEDIQAYQQYLRDNGYSNEVVNGVSQGLNSGNKEIADWIAQYNKRAGTTPIKIPQTETEIALAKKGEFNIPQSVSENIIVSKADNAPKEEHSKTIIDKIANGLGNFSKGYEENKNNAFKPENMYSDSSKGLMNRLGEGAGTIARTLNKPATQALISGLTTAALGGDALAAIGNAYKVGKMKSTSNLYQEALKRNGVDVDVNPIGYLSREDMNTLMIPKYKDAANNIALAKIKEQQNYRDLLMQHYNDKLNENREYHEALIKNNSDRLEETIRHNKEMMNYYGRKLDEQIRNNKENTNIKNKNAQSKQISAQASMIKAQKTGNGRKSSGNSTRRQTSTRIPKPQENKDWGNDLAGYSQRLYDPRYAEKVPAMKAKFIQKYGVDPDKYIKY